MPRVEFTAYPKKKKINDMPRPNSNKRNILDTSLFLDVFRKFFLSTSKFFLWNTSDHQVNFFGMKNFFSLNSGGQKKLLITKLFFWGTFLNFSKLISKNCTCKLRTKNESKLTINKSFFGNSLFLMINW